MTTKNIATTIATGALLFSTFASTAFAADITITGNGSDSNNRVDIDSNSSTTVVQNNSANITNNVSSSTNTGGNNSNSNTGGSVSINTGNSHSGVNVATSANLNQVSLPCACLNSGNNGTITIAGNGHNSTNNVDVDSGRARNTSDTQVFQNNTATITNDVDTHANTGRNDANSNTAGLSGGSVSINTGGILSNVGVSNAANANVVKLGSSGTTGGNGAGWTVNILGNGEDSRNRVDLDNNRSVLVEQNNSARISNDVDTHANTGRNNENSNTGGSNSINTGNAFLATAVDNLANFNSADVSCGCLLGGGTTVTLSGNGHNSRNIVDVDGGNSFSVFQGGKDGGNDATIYNDVDGNAKTGRNSSNSNTGWSGSSDSIMTGSTNSITGVSTETNLNQVGPSLAFPLPGGFKFDAKWNLSDLWSFFHWVS